MLSYCIKEKPSSSFEIGEEEKEKEKEHALTLFDQIDFTADALIIYGLGLGYIFPKIAFCLEGKSLFIIEDEEYESFSATSHADAFFPHPKTELLFLQSPLHIDKMIKEICWKMVFSTCQILAHPNYSKKPIYQEIKKSYSHHSMGVKMVASEFSDLGEGIYHNVYRNFLSISRCKPGKALHNAFENVPAIICGGGPSLSKHITDLSQQKALLFAGGETLSLLQEHNITPHFAAAIDKRAPYRKIKEGAFLDIPFFLQGRNNKDHLPYIEGDLFLLPENGFYPLADWLWRQIMPDLGHFDGGWHVGTFLAQLACYMGCSPIIFVGMDLSFNKSYYAFEKKGEIDADLILAQDGYGNEIYTKADFALSVAWLQGLAKENPDRFKKAGKDGLDLGKEIASIELKECLDFLPQRDLPGMIQCKLQQIDAIHRNKEQKIKHLKKVQNSLLRCEKICQSLLDSSSTNSDLLAEELGYQLLLKPFWQVWKYLIGREIDKQEENSELKMAINRLIFFQTLADKHSNEIEKACFDEI